MRLIKLWWTKLGRRKGSMGMRMGGIILGLWGRLENHNKEKRAMRARNLWKRKKKWRKDKWSDFSRK